MMDIKFRSRKFILAILSLLSGIVALFTGFMIDTVFVGLVGTVLALYGGANVMQGKQNGN